MVNYVKLNIKHIIIIKIIFKIKTKYREKQNAVRHVYEINKKNIFFYRQSISYFSWNEKNKVFKDLRNILL